MSKKKICCNCKYAGHQFKVGNLTHLHCEKPEYEEMAKNSDPPSPWETLREFGWTCDDFQPK